MVVEVPHVQEGSRTRVVEGDSMRSIMLVTTKRFLEERVWVGHRRIRRDLR